MGLLGSRNYDGNNMNLSNTEKAALIYEVMLVAAFCKATDGADNPKIDLFRVLDAIMKDKTYSCTTRQTMIMTLRKSPVWEKVRPFLEYGDYTCARKGCQCSRYSHKDETGKCESVHYKNDPNHYGHYTKTPCTCTGFIPKDFK